MGLRNADRFRFDLAAALARELDEIGTLTTFFDIIHQYTILLKIKLIAEPWALGRGGYDTGKLPLLWSEWNRKYLDWIKSGILARPRQSPSLVCPAFYVKF